MQLFVLIIFLITYFLIIRFRPKARYIVHFSVFVFLVSVSVIGCTKQVEKKDSMVKTEDSAIVKTEDQLKGADKIDDVVLRKRILKYIGGSLTPEEEYAFYSKSHLQLWYPHVKNIEDFKKTLEGAEIEPVETINLEISEFGKINENKVYFDLIRKSSDAPGGSTMIKTKHRYIFVKEDGVWKFDTEDSSGYKVIRE